MSGGCNLDCPLLQDGNCTEPEENYMLVRQVKLDKIVNKIEKN